MITNSLIDARAERSAKEARLHSLRAMRARGHGLESTAEVLSSPLILNLREREMESLREEAQLSREYGAQHPLIHELRAEQQKLADRIEHEIDNVIANLENEVALARSRESAHAEHLREAKGQSMVTGRRRSSCASWSARSRRAGRSTRRCWSASRRPSSSRRSSRRTPA